MFTVIGALILSTLSSS